MPRSSRWLRLADRDRPDVSVVVPTTTGAERLERLVGSVRGAASVEVVIVVNGADEPTTAVAQAIQASTPHVHVVSSDVNRGFGGGVNLGAARARGETLLLTHDDAEFHEGAVDALVAGLSADPRLGALTGTVRETTAGSDQVQHQLGSVIDEHALTAAIQSPPEDDAVFPVDYAGTALLAIRRGWFEQVGGLDPGFYPAYFTDVDFAFRLRAVGGVIACLPAAVADHHSGSSTSAGFKVFVADRNRERFLARWGHALAPRAGIGLDDPALRAFAAGDARAARAGRAPGPRTEPVPALPPDQWFHDRSSALERSYHAFLEERLAFYEAHAANLQRQLDAVVRG